MVNNPQPTDFQTPPEVCRYMVDMIPQHAITVLEPTPGQGNLVSALDGFRVTAPDNFFELYAPDKYDAIVMNPPFSLKHAFGVPPEIEKPGMRLGYHILAECMKRSDSVIALMPWFTVTDLDVRLREMKAFGLKSITALPRKTFSYSRIQTCIFEMRKGWKKETLFYSYQFPV